MALIRLVLTVLCAGALLQGAAAAHDVDPHALPLGDGKLSTAPKAGYIWPCRVDPGAGGAFRDGPWINSAAGTYDFDKKAIVDGSVTWPHDYKVSLSGDVRHFKTNDLPDHPTGTFPIAPSDDAYQTDRNPNSIRAQDFDFDLPANPQLAAQPTCAPGAIGVLITGSVLFNALDAPGRDAVAHETQDGCQGHPQPTGVYHYHSVTTCLPDRRMANGHSGLVGYMIDGFGIYGRYDAGGVQISSSDLDECHGHVGDVDWDEKVVRMYHYHASWDFPYTAGCLKGVWSQQTMMKISGGPPAGRGGPGGPGGRRGPPPGF